MSASFSSQSFTPDALIAGNAHLLTGHKVIVESGQVLGRGAVVGKKTAGDEYVLSLSAASDGSQLPDAVIAEDVDASAGAKQALVYFRGDFIEQELTIGTGHTADSIREGLRVKGITLIKRG